MKKRGRRYYTRCRGVLQRYNNYELCLLLLLVSVAMSGMTWWAASSYFASQIDHLRENVEYLEMLAKVLRKGTYPSAGEDEGQKEKKKRTEGDGVGKGSTTTVNTKLQQKELLITNGDTQQKIQIESSKDSDHIIRPSKEESQPSSRQSSDRVSLVQVISFASLMMEDPRFPITRQEYWGNISQQIQAADGGHEGGMEVRVVDADFIRKGGDEGMSKHFAIPRDDEVHDFSRRFTRTMTLTNVFNPGLLSSSEGKVANSRGGASILKVLRSAEDHGKDGYVLFSTALTSFSGGILKESFYKDIALELSKAATGIALIATHSRNGNPSGLQTFVIPREWVAYLQLGGLPYSLSASGAICSLFENQVDLLAEERDFKVIRKDYPVSLSLQPMRRGSVFVERRAEESPQREVIERMWNLVHAVDSFYMILPNKHFAKWEGGLNTQGCSCYGGENSDKVEPGGAATGLGGTDCEVLNIPLATLKTEHQRACALLREMKTKAVDAIPINLRPTFALGDLRDFRNPQSCSQQLGLPVTNLASFPRSGNTWLRRMLERATGILTGSVYGDIRLKEAGLAGEMTKEDVLVVKEHHHHLYSDKFPHVKSERAIHLSRNPFSSVESHYHFLYSGDHGRSAEGRGKKWVDFVKDQVPMCARFEKWWLDAPSHLGIPILRVKYEDLEKNATAELKRIVSWLGFTSEEVSDQRIRCAVHTPCEARKACRARDKQKEEDHFDESLTAYVMAQLGDTMQSLGYNGKPAFFS